jgi:hypothetical protein
VGGDDVATQLGADGRKVGAEQRIAARCEARIITLATRQVFIGSGVHGHRAPAGAVEVLDIDDGHLTIV